MQLKLESTGTCKHFHCLDYNINGVLFFNFPHRIVVSCVLCVVVLACLYTHNEEERERETHGEREKEPSIAVHMDFPRTR